MDDGGEWLSYSDAAIRLSITPDAVRQRVKRGRMKAARTNSGHPVVWVKGRDKTDKPVVTNRNVTTEQTGQTGQQTEQHDARPDRLGELYASLEQELRRRAEAAEARADRAEEQAVAARQEVREARERIDGMVDRLGGLERALGTAEAAVAAAEGRHRTETATLRAEVALLKDALEAVRRPWWRRLIGR